MGGGVVNVSRSLLRRSFAEFGTRRRAPAYVAIPSFRAGDCAQIRPIPILPFLSFHLYISVPFSFRPFPSCPFPHTEEKAARPSYLLTHLVPDNRRYISYRNRGYLVFRRAVRVDLFCRASVSALLKSVGQIDQLARSRLSGKHYFPEVGWPRSANLLNRGAQYSLG